MFKNYFKIAWRNVARSKSFSLINISGLAIGMATTILIFLWIQNELSFDSSYKKTDRLYQVYNRETDHDKAAAWGSTPDALAPVLKADYPDIEDAVRVSESEALLSLQGKHLKASGIFADAGFISLFDFPVLSGIPLYDKSENGQMVSGQLERVKLFALIAGFILLIACINFVNLSTARSEKRAKEVGIRKVAGAKRQSLIFQFIIESILLTFVAGCLAIVLVQLFLPAYNNLLQSHFQLPLTDVSFWMYWFVFIVITGILSGCYPAFFLSSFSAAKVLKGAFKQSGKNITPRKVLVVMQFTFAVVLIVSTLVISKQIKYAEDRDTGFEKGELAFSPLEGNSIKNYEPIKQEMLNSGAVVSVTKSLVPISAEWTSNMWGYQWQGSTKDDSQISFDAFSSDADFAKTLGTTIISGRDIDIYHYPTDSTAILLNEKAVQTMQLKNPIGQTIRRGDDEVYHVVGIIKDFLIGSPYSSVQPMVVMGPKYGWYRDIHYKLNAAQPAKANLDKISAIFKKYNPDYPFEYQFVNEAYAEKFKSEETTKTLAFLFAGLTIFISCLGLFGLAAYMAENRIKEIGIRKVLGASVLSITTLLSGDFVKLVIISIIIAMPVAWWAMHNWLQSYAYRTPISASVFILSGILAVVIALLTVSFQAIKAALANPVKSLRTE